MRRNFPEIAGVASLTPEPQVIDLEWPLREFAEAGVASLTLRRGFSRAATLHLSIEASHLSAKVVILIEISNGYAHLL